MITFLLNNELIETEQKAGMTLLDFVRYNRRKKGSKIGCREGDCGACTVLVGTLQQDGQVSYRSITSCISPLGNANGKHIVTIEGTNLDGKLSRAQQAMYDNYATQCGFCTPGFVVSLTGYCLRETIPTKEGILDAISGNICRCTGYKSIERAAEQLYQELLLPSSNGRQSHLIAKGFIPEYFATIPERLAKIKDNDAPRGKETPVAGGTDLYVRHADRLTEEAVSLFQAQHLGGITIKNGLCTIGAGVTATEFMEHPDMNLAFPNLRQHLLLLSSEPIRNMASLAGNFVNASPIGDMSIFFLALDAQLQIENKEGKQRVLPFRSFYKTYKVYDLQEGEFIRSFSFKLPTAAQHFNFEKVCKRQHLDIASVNSAALITLEDDRIADIHCALGGVAAIPLYLEKTCQFLKGSDISPKSIAAANDVLQSEISPISDVRGSADYKRLLARQLFFAHFLQHFPNQVSLSALTS